MAQYFKPKKRRAPAGPNKNEKKVMRERDSQSGGLLGQLFPTVQKLTIQMDFLTPQHDLLDQETRTFNPQSPFELSVPCQGRCGRGMFDLESKIKSIIEARQGRAEASGTCQEPIFLGSKDPCGFHLRCKIEVSYTPTEE